MDDLRKVPSPPTAEHPISAEDSRQGDIVLRRPWQRIVFIAGLAAAVLLAAAAVLWLR
jgi:hypothetical protein